MNYEPRNMRYAIRNTRYASRFTKLPLYTCRDASTNQLLFMQNKPNFRKSQMNANLYNTTDYENKWQRRVRKNKPNSNPIKPNLKRAKMNANDFITKDYRKKGDFVVRINKPNFQNAQNERKLNFNKGLQKKRLFSRQKTNPIQTQFLQRPKSLAKKPGHTRRSPMGAIILTFVSNMHILKRFLQGEVK